MTRLLALAAAAWLAGCAGPRPQVESVRVAPAAPGRVFVTVVVRNQGRGEGQVAIEVTLRDRTDRSVVAREAMELEIHPHERMAVSREVAVPDGRDVDAEAAAHYPPS